MSDDPARRLLLDWLLAIRAGTMSRDALLAIRGRVDPVCNEFPPSELLSDVRAACARALGFDPADSDVSAVVPDHLPTGWSRW